MNAKEFWKDNWKDPKHRRTNPFAKKVYKIIKNKNYNTILDLGCGDGRDTFYFAKKGYRVTAVDYSQSGMHHIEEKIKKEHLKDIVPVRQDITKVTFSRGSFDVIYAHLIVHYFDEKETTKLFSKLYDILKTGGMLFVKVKSTEDAFWGRGKKLGENYYFYEGHERHFFDFTYMKKQLKKWKRITIKKTSSTYNNYKSCFIEAVVEK